jgi:MFS family permease
MHLAQETSKGLSRSKFLPFIVCFAASLFFFYEFIQGNMFSSIADNLMQDFQIGADKMTYLSSIYYLSNVIFLFIAGYVLDHYSPKKTLLWAMLSCVVSTFLFAHTTSFSVALICRFIAGIGSAFCFLGPIRVASHWFPVNRMAMITGMIVTFAMTGGILSQYPLAQLVQHIGWRQSVDIVGWFGLFLFILMAWGIRETHTPCEIPHEPVKVDLLKTFKNIYLNPTIIKSALYTSLMNMAVAVFGAMMGTLYLMQRLDVPKSTASMINSMLFFGAIIGGPLVGWISDHLQKRIVPMKISAAITLWLILMVMYMPMNAIMMGFVFFLVGLVTAAQVISYAFVAETHPPAITAMAVSAISVLTQGGYVIYQNIFSFILTHTGEYSVVQGAPVYTLHSYQIAAIILPLGVALAYLLSSRLRETHSTL